MTRPRTIIVVTGSELVRGERRDENGPFLAREALALGLEPARTVVVGDDPAELEETLRQSLDADLCVVSGGLGPTHDDRTVETVARVTGRALRLDTRLRDEIEAVSRSVAARSRRPYADFEAGVRKQATLPDGALSLGLAGTAPGFVLEGASSVVVVLPGPPAELRRLWAIARTAEPMQRVLARAKPPGRGVLRFFGASESAVAKALAQAGGDGGGVDATICARDYEIHVDFVYRPDAARRACELADAVAAALPEYLFARDDRSVEAIVLGVCRTRGLTLATAESCTGGMVAARVTDVAGASDVFRGSVVAYADAVKRSELGVPSDVLERYGAVSAETAAAMTAGARRRLEADVAVGVTGVACPGGGTAEKQVGLVYLHAAGPDGERARELRLHGDRDAIRRRATVSALHLVRTLLTQTHDEGV